MIAPVLMNLDLDVDLNPHLDRNRNRNLNESSQLHFPGDEQVRMLTFHKLDAYQFSIEFLRLALEVIQDVPRGHADDIDQLRRSAKSTARNIAEGAGRLSPADKVKHYAIARGEAVESACSLDVMRLEGTISEDRYHRGIALLERVISTVTGLMKKPE